jgi:hypothetical protein
MPRRIGTAQRRDLVGRIIGQVASLLDASPDKSPRRQLLHQTARQLEGTQRPHTRQDAVAVLAELLVHSRLVWLLADPALHRASAESDIFPRDQSLAARLLRKVPPAGNHPTEDHEDWASIEASLAELEAMADPGSRPPDSAHCDEMCHELDAWLAARDPKRRRQLGAFYTPHPLAAHMVRRVDTTLRDEFGLADGLADLTTWGQIAERVPVLWDSAADRPGQPFVRILDPALGTGVFLVAVVDVVHDTLCRKWREGGQCSQQIGRHWNDYVERSLLPRMTGVELLLPTAIVAWLRIAEKLAVTGYHWRQPTAWNVIIADSLAEPQHRHGAQGDGRAQLRSGAASEGRGPMAEPARPFTIVLGNPPFSALTTNHQPWINDLLRSRILAGRSVGSFYEVDGKPLGEKKLWLHDDYVKFLRLAQWHIENAGCGVVGFVTNHGYLDNVTFRGVRQSLLATFPRMSLFDLHGNRKKGEQAPDGSRDENVFAIDQGVAVAILSKPPSQIPACVEYRDTWGTRESKLAVLDTDSTNLAAQRLDPASPYFFLVPSAATAERIAEYERGFSLTDVMPLYSSAAVTARDGLAVAFDRRELLDRMSVFCDPAIPDEEVGERLLTTRSSRYAPGNTRGWKIHDARQRARAAPDLASLARRCQYRPFDYRVALWADWMIDWPRDRVMRHMLSGGNLALVTRRQMLPNHPCNFFFVTETIVIDGLLRSDNRGNESFFTLYVRPDRMISPLRATSANFGRGFLERCEKQFGLRFLDSPHGDLKQTLGAEDLFAVIYAQFHSEVYRRRYSEALRLAFPRVFLPRPGELLQSLVGLGRQLMAAHRLRETSPTSDPAAAVITREPHPGIHPADADALSQSGNGQQFVQVQGRYPCLDAGAIRLSDDCRLPNVDEAVWNYRIGAHQVCRKWLRDRHGRKLSWEELAQFGNVIQAIRQTLETVRAIDGAIADAGGWPAAFVGRDSPI